MNPMKSMSPLVLLAVMASVSAAEPNAPLDRLVSCTTIGDTKARLACFDREIAPLAKARSASTAAPAAPALSTSPNAPAGALPPPAPRPFPSPAPATASVPSPPKSFGQEQLKGESRPQAKEEDLVMHGTIASIQKVSTNAWLVTLDNGQGWRHEDEVLGGYLKIGDAITIRKASLGTYRLTRDAGESKNWMRVIRVR